MDPQARITKALLGEEPDRVPIFIPGYSTRFKSDFDQVTGNNQFGSETCICNGKDLTPLTHFGIDCCEVPGPPHLSDGQAPPVLEDFNDDHFVDIFGRIFQDHVLRDASYRVYKGPYLQTEEMIQSWEFAVPQVIDPVWFDRVYEEIINAIENHGICPIFTGCDGLYNVLETSIGVKNTAYMLHDYPEFLDMHLEKIFKVWMGDVRGILEAGGAFIMISDNITVKNRPTITPDLVKKHLLPYYRKFVDVIHSKGGRAFFRTRGDIISVIETVLEAGFDAIHVTTPEISYLEELTTFWGEDITLMGNIDTISLLSFGTPAQVRKTVRDTMQFAKTNEKFILGTNGELENSVRYKNVEAMVKTAKTYGYY
ncbi:MAG: uroporphyrinogen decarboxylase family protein [Promethearchaeota archaeon]